MSVKKWREQAAAAAKLEKQEYAIRQDFKRAKYAKEFGQISAEKLFQPITSRLDRNASATETEPEAGPDYTMDEFDRINPFGWEDFQPDAETPYPSEEEGEAGEDEDEGEEEVSSDPPRKTWGEPVRPVEPKFIQNTNESVLLQTVNQLINQYDYDTNYRVKSKASPFRGYSIKDLKKVRDNIEERRRGGRPSPQAPDDEMKGSGLERSDQMIDQLYLMFGSIRAGNTSSKLRRVVVALLSVLVKQGIINDFQRRKIIKDYIQ